jgi:hypothetical protein
MDVALARQMFESCHALSASSMYIDAKSYHASICNICRDLTWAKEVKKLQGMLLDYVG